MSTVKNIKAVIAHIKNKNFFKAQDALAFLAVGASEKDIEEMLQIFHKADTPESKKALTQFLMMSHEDQLKFIDEQLKDRIEKVKEKFPEIDEKALQRKAVDTAIEKKQWQERLGKQLNDILKPGNKESINLFNKTRENRWEDAISSSLITAADGDNAQEVWEKFNSALMDTISDVVDNKVTVIELMKKLEKAGQHIDKEMKNNKDSDVLTFLKHQHSTIIKLISYVKTSIKENLLN